MPMHQWTCRLAPALILLAVLPATSLWAQEPKPEDKVFNRQNVDKRIAAYVDELWKLQNADGHWDELKRPGGVGQGPENYGGQTALIMLALKVAGTEEDNQNFQRGLKWLKGEKGAGTYFRGLRAVLFSQLKDPDCHRICREDGKLLGNGVIDIRGTHTYTPWRKELPNSDTIPGDFSNTQYAVLGVWVAGDYGLEIPIKYWQLIEKGYLENQCPDGSWSYGESHGKGTGYGSMTAGGLATCFILWDRLYLANDPGCHGRVNPDLIKAIDHGLKWMDENFSAIGNAKSPSGINWNDGYYFYGLERVGVASGLKYFGNHDWFRESTEALLAGKAAPWGPQQHAWTLMFLCYGRAPVAINKLKFAGAWNERPRDCAGLCRYLTKAYEHHHNWQIIPIDAARQDELHDAPVLAISGKASFTLKPDEVRKIRTYLLRGGTLFAEAIDGSAVFVKSVKALCQAMFPSLEVTRLPADHPLYTCHVPLAKGQAAPPELLGLSDGVRTMVIISPKDVGCDWQRGNVASARTKFDFGDNLVAYASDRGQLWSKESSYWPADLGKRPAATVTVGRVVHGDLRAEHVWNPTGGAGWQRQDILSRNAGGPAIATTQCDLVRLGGPGQLDPKHMPILHLTGASSIALSEEAKKNLKDYVSAGGLLLADAAGGGAGAAGAAGAARQAFIDSFAKLVEDVFGGNLKLSAVSPADLPFVSQVSEDGKVWYRHRFNLPRALRPLEVLGLSVDQGGARRWGVLFLPYDLTYAMTGAPAFDPAGLDPPTADKLIGALLQWAQSSKSVPTTAPAGN